MSVDAEDKQKEAARLLEKEIDNAAHDEECSFFAINNAIGLIIDAAAKKARAEIRPDVPPPAPPQWEVYLTYLDINNNPTGNEARIGLYAAQDDAGHVAQLLNKLTSSAYNFDHRQV